MGKVSGGDNPLSRQTEFCHWLVSLSQGTTITLERIRGAAPLPARAPSSDNRTSPLDARAVGSDPLHEWREQVKADGVEADWDRSGGALWLRPAAIDEDRSLYNLPLRVRVRNETNVSASS